MSRVGVRKPVKPTLTGPADAFTVKSHALALMHKLQSLTPAENRTSTFPRLSLRSSSMGTGGVSPQRKFSPMGPPITPSMTRSAQRSRAAALANGKASHVRTPSHAAGLGDVPRKRIDVMARLVEALSKSARLRYELPVEELIACVFPSLADQAGKEVRASAYRLLRHALVRPPWKLMRLCREAGLDLYLARTLLRDSRFDVEKEQALKLIRAVMDLGSSSTGEEDLISVSIVRALVAAADHGEEKLRVLYLETLAELAIHDTGLLIRGGGLRSVLQTLNDGPFELAPSILSLLLSLMDLPRTRHLFRPGFDLELALSSFTEAREDEASLQNASHMVSLMLRSWPGLLYLSLYKQRAIRSLILALRVNAIEVQDKILDVFSDLFNIKGAEQRVASSAQRFRPPNLFSSTSTFNLLDHFLSLMVVTLINCGLVEAIVHVLEYSSDLSRKATLLMGQLTQIASRNLPSEYGVRVHALPDLFRAMFARLDEKGVGERDKAAREREKASLALCAIDGHELDMVRNQAATTPAPSDRSNSVTTSTRAASQVDEGMFRNMLLEANVLNTKDHTKWNVDTLVHIFEAIQGHPKRLDEAMRLSKLGKRVLAFYHPFALQYSAMGSNAKTLRYTKLGCTVMQTLVSNGDGLRFLAEDKLLKELCESLDSDMMTSQRAHDTLILGYFEMLGVLTRSDEGQMLMHRVKLFSTLYRTIEDSDREAITKAILQHFDFSRDGHCRVMLSKILTSSSPPMRSHATHAIAAMIHASPARWLVRLLVTQLYDAGAEVREVASQLLLEVCTSSTRALEMVVSLRPMLEGASHSLLLKFISTSIGMRYLLQGNYIDREMDEWFNNRNYLYTVELEVLLARSLHVNRRQDDTQLQWDGSIPPHFYGELAKTSEGCQVLARKGHFAEFVHFIRTHSGEEEDVEVINKVKSTLWAVGNIGATEGGVPFLEAEGVVANIVQVAHSSTVYSLRGTCYFVLGLIATTQQGAELVEDQGWITSAHNSVGYCIPPLSLLDVPAWEPVTPFTSVSVHSAETRIERTIMLNISNLGNSILANKASRTLAKLKHKNRHLFLRKSIELFVRSLFISDYHYLRQPVRRFIWELFEIKLDQACVNQILECRQRLLSGIKHQRTNSTGKLSASEVMQQRQGDEVLGSGLDDNDDVVDEDGDDDDGDDDEEDDEEAAEERDEDEHSGVSSFYRPLADLSRKTRKGRRGERGDRLGGEAAAYAPRSRIVGGFTLAESIVRVQ